MRKLEIDDRTFMAATQVSFWALWLCAVVFFAGVAINFPSVPASLALLAVAVVGVIWRTEMPFTFHGPSFFLGLLAGMPMLGLS